MNTQKFFDQAMESSWGLKKLNFLLQRMIPFNKPHRLVVSELKQNSAKVKIPYVRKNMNHLKGLHACCLATATEFCCGIVLGNKYGLSKYRLIMKNLEMEYLYQAKMESFSFFELPEDTLNSIAEFERGEEVKLLIQCIVKTFDIQNNHLATGTIIWQLKKWEAVKTK